MEISNYDQQAVDFLNATSAKISIKHKGYGKHFVEDKVSRHIFRIKLKTNLGSYSFDFGQSIANGAKEPTAYSILACIQKYDPEAFEDFCSAFSYDQYDDYTGKENKVSKKIYNACCKEWEKVDKLFTDEQIDLLRDIN